MLSPDNSMHMIFGYKNKKQNKKHARLELSEKIRNVRQTLEPSVLTKKRVLVRLGLVTQTT